MTWIFTAQSNDTCDIFRSGTGPPLDAPAVAGVPIYIVPRFRNLKGNFQGLFQYTHIVYMPLGTDVRDVFTGSNFIQSTGDILFIPDQQNPGFTLGVVFVCRRRIGADYLEVYCFAQSKGGYPQQEG
jgi:hypothetical protein